MYIPQGVKILVVSDFRQMSEPRMHAGSDASNVAMLNDNR